MVIAKELLMIVKIKHSWSFYTVFHDIFGNFFLVIAGTTPFSMIFLDLSFVQMYFSILYAWKPLCQFHQQQQKKQQNPVFEGSLNLCYGLWFISGFSFLSNFTLYQVTFLPNSSETHSIKRRYPKSGKWMVLVVLCG